MFDQLPRMKVNFLFKFLGGNLPFHSVTSAAMRLLFHRFKSQVVTEKFGATIALLH
jgi:hypothetical protein